MTLIPESEHALEISKLRAEVTRLQLDKGRLRGILEGAATCIGLHRDVLNLNEEMIAHAIVNKFDNMRMEYDYLARTCSRLDGHKRDDKHWKRVAREALEHD